MYDAFISYRRDGGFEMARLVYEHLKAAGLNPFFDLEELQAGHFNEDLYRAIEDSPNFLLVLPKNSLARCVSEDDWLRLEIEHAISQNKNIIPLMLDGFIWDTSLPESLKEIQYYNGVKISREYFDASIAKLIEMLTDVVGNKAVKQDSKRVERVGNKYLSFEDKEEFARLKIQQELMRDFDTAVYDEVKQSYSEIRILDVGSNNGDFIMDRLGSSDNVSMVIGLEFDAGSVDAANSKYGGEGKARFYTADVESSDFADLLDKIVADNGIESFNVINISMLLLHLKTPYQLLKKLRKYLSSDGTLIIKDIDDGLNIAYPDDNGDFARVVDICKKNEASGFRESGRQILTLLTRAGYRDIQLRNLGISTIGMNYDQRSALFETYFSFVLGDAKIQVDRHPQDKRAKADYEWYLEHYDDLEEKFHDSGFFFLLGFLLVTAAKQ